MGTRGAVYIRYRGIVYCFFSHHDSYFEGLGITVLEWIYRLLKERKLNDFLNQWTTVLNKEKTNDKEETDDEIRVEMLKKELNWNLDSWPINNRCDWEDYYLVDFDSLKFQYIKEFIVMDFKDVFESFNENIELKDLEKFEVNDTLWYLLCLTKQEDKSETEINGINYKRFIISEEERDKLYFDEIYNKIKQRNY